VTRYCSRSCRLLFSKFEEFTTLQFILMNARWAGCESQEQLQKQYHVWQLRDAVKRLPKSEDSLGELLIEIVEDMEATLAVL
jgi:cell fate (sporulation/competence/biofilm development) regulator YlbF (YheA/YmcA/DUF963 family)